MRRLPFILQGRKATAASGPIPKMRNRSTPGCRAEKAISSPGGQVFCCVEAQGVPCSDARAPLIQNVFRDPVVQGLDENKASISSCFVDIQVIFLALDDRRRLDPGSVFFDRGDKQIAHGPGAG